MQIRSVYAKMFRFECKRVEHVFGIGNSCIDIFKMMNFQFCLPQNVQYDHAQ